MSKNTDWQPATFCEECRRAVKAPISHAEGCSQYPKETRSEKPKSLREAVNEAADTFGDGYAVLEAWAIDVVAQAWRDGRANERRGYVSPRSYARAIIEGKGHMSKTMRCSWCGKDVDPEGHKWECTGCKPKPKRRSLWEVAEDFVRVHSNSTKPFKVWADKFRAALAEEP